MSASAEVLRQHLAYHAWASRRAVDAASKLNAEELERDFQTSEHSVLGTLVHVFAADRAWMGRIAGAPPMKFLDVAVDRHMTVLETDWPRLLQQWADWAHSIDDSQAAANLVYKDLKGNPHETPLWQVVMHVVNHGTHHRGQVSGMLRAMNHTPPQLDLIAFYRGLQA